MLFFMPIVPLICGIILIWLPLKDSQLFTIVFPTIFFGVMELTDSDGLANMAVNKKPPVVIANIIIILRDIISDVVIFRK